MRYKRIIVLASVCAVLGLGVYITGNKSNMPSSPGIDPGIKDPSKIAAVKLKIKDSEANLALKDGVWRVSDKQDFQADFSMVREIVSQFNEIKVDRSFDSDEEILKRLGFSSGSEEDTKPTLVSFSDAGGKVLAEYLIGSSRKGGGQYFMHKDGKVIYLSLKEFSGLAKTSKDLLKRQIMNPDKAKIVRVFCEKAGQKIYTLERQKDSDQLNLAEVEEGKEVDQSKISGLSGFVSPFMIEDVASEKRPAKADAAVLIYEFKDGSFCRIIPAEKKEGDADENCVNIEVSKADGDAGLIKGLDLQKFSFFIPKWKLDVMVSDKALLFKQPAAKPEMPKMSPESGKAEVKQEISKDPKKPESVGVDNKQ